MPLTLVPDAIEDYAAAHADPVSPLLDELRVQTRAQMQWHQMQVGRVEGSFLRMIVRLIGARRILELGMFTGYSALCMAEALPDDGTLVTCDVDPKAEAIARAYFARSPHGKKIEVRMGPGLETIKTLTAPLDLVFIDADKENYSAYFDAVFPLVRKGGLIVADNTLWSGKVLDPQDESTRAIVAYNAKIAADPRVARVLLTVRDGMMLSQKL